MIYKFYYPYYMSNPWKPNKPTQLPATNNSSQSNASKPLPPWMKNKGQPQQNTPQQMPQEKSSSPIKQQAKSLPAWMKNKTQKQSQTKPQQQKNSQPEVKQEVKQKSVPAWMKGKSGPPGGSIQKNQTPSGESTPRNQPEEKQKKPVPAWMKNKQNQSPSIPSQNSPEKMEEVKLNLNESLERSKEDESIKIIEENEEKPDKQEGEQGGSEEEDEVVEKIKKKQKTLKKVKSQKKISKKQSPIKSPKKGKTKKDSLFMKSVDLFNESCSKESDYYEKIESQKQLLQCLQKFTKATEQKLISYMKEKKIVQRKKNILNFENIRVEYALVEGSTVQNKTSFKASALQDLRNRFRFYNFMQQIIIKLIKRLAIFRIRVPLMCMIEYKGIQFLCQSVCEEISDVIDSPATNFSEITSELIQIEKELKQIDYCVDRTNFTIKKLFTEGEQTYILYLNEDANFKFQLEELTISSLTDTSAFMTGNIDFSLDHEHIKKLRRTSSERVCEHLDIYELAKSIQVVYRSCQGETDEESFWSLVLQENQHIWSMIMPSYKEQSEQHQQQERMQGLVDSEKQGEKQKLREKQRGLPEKAILLQIMECLLPIKFNYHNNIFEEKKKVVMSIQPKVSTYKYSNLELFEVCTNFEKYIREDKLELAEESIKIQQTLSQMESLFISSSILKKNQVNFSIYKKEYDKVVQLIQEMAIPKWHFDNITFLPLLITTYMLNGNEIKMLETFGRLLDILSYYYREEMWIHSNIYSMMAEYYSKSKHSEEAKKFLQHSYQIANHYFGVRSTEVGEIMVEKAQIHFNLKEYSECQRIIEQALKIYKSSSKHSLKIVECMSILGKAKIKNNRVETGKQLLEKAIVDYIKLEHPKQAISIYYFLIQLQTKLETQFEMDAYLQKIAQIGFNFKYYTAIKSVIRSALVKELKSFTSQKYELIKKLEVEEEAQATDELILSLEEQTHNFGSLVEMIKWSINVVCLKTNSCQWERAANILSDLLSFFNTTERQQILA